MANYKHPEFHLLHKLQLIQDKHPEIEDIGLLVDETLDIINENAITLVQQASLYALLGKPGDLSAATKNKLRKILSGAMACLDLDDEPAD
jgi:hypothetical protein